jgi:hypothetical protein
LQRHELEAEGVIKKTPYFIQLPITQLSKFSTGKKKTPQTNRTQQSKEEIEKITNENALRYLLELTKTCKNVLSKNPSQSTIKTSTTIVS